MKDLHEKITELCEEAGVDFVFMADGKCTWSVEEDNYLHDVVQYCKLRMNQWKDSEDTEV